MITIYWATNHAQTIKNKLFSHLSGQKEVKSEIPSENYLHSFEKIKKSPKSDLKTVNQAYGIKL